MQLVTEVTGVVSGVVTVALDGLADSVRSSVGAVAQTMAVSKSSVAVAESAIAQTVTVAESVAVAQTVAVAETSVSQTSVTESVSVSAVAQSRSVQTAVQTQSSGGSLLILSFGFFGLLNFLSDGAGDQSKEGENLQQFQLDHKQLVPLKFYSNLP